MIQCACFLCPFISSSPQRADDLNAHPSRKLLTPAFSMTGRLNRYHEFHSATSEQSSPNIVSFHCVSSLVPVQEEDVESQAWCLPSETKEDVSNAPCGHSWRLSAQEKTVDTEKMKEKVHQCRHGLGFSCLCMCEGCVCMFTRLYFKDSLSMEVSTLTAHIMESIKDSQNK